MNKGSIYWIKNILFSIKHKNFGLLNICHVYFMETFIFRIKIIYSEIYFYTTKKRRFLKIKNRKIKYYHPIKKPINITQIDDKHFQIDKIAINELQTIKLKNIYQIYFSRQWNYIKKVMDSASINTLYRRRQDKTSIFALPTFNL